MYNFDWSALKLEDQSVQLISSCLEFHPDKVAQRT